MPKRTTLTYTSYDAPKQGAQQLYVYYCKYSGQHALTTGAGAGGCSAGGGSTSSRLRRMEHDAPTRSPLVGCEGWLAHSMRRPTPTPCSCLTGPLPLPHLPALAPTACADVDIERLPRRRTDRAYILDKEEHMLRLYTEDGGLKHIRRANGDVEEQHRCGARQQGRVLGCPRRCGVPMPTCRLCPPAPCGSVRRVVLGRLPIAYTCGKDDRLVYILDDAVISYQRELGEGAAEGQQMGATGT